MPLPDNYASRNDWGSHSEQGVFTARNMFQLDGTGLFLATVLVVFVLYKQAYLRWEERKSYTYIAQKLARKDGQVTMVALVSDDMSLVKHSRVIQAVNRVPGVAVSALAGIGNVLAADHVVHKHVDGQSKAAAARAAASAGDSDDGPQMKAARGLAKKFAVPVVRSGLAQVTCDPSISAVVLFLSSSITPSEAARALLMSIEAGKHVICAGPGGAQTLSGAATIRQVRAAIALAGRAGGAATPVVYPASPYRFHPLYHRLRARLRMVAPVKRIDVDVRFPIWQGAVLALVNRVPFALKFVPYRAYASAWAMYSDFSAACFSADVARQVAITASGTDAMMTEGLRRVAIDSGTDAGVAEAADKSVVVKKSGSPAAQSCGVRAQKWECGDVGSDGRGLKVTFTTGTRGLWFPSSTVTAKGEHGTLTCANLDNPSTGHKLVVDHDRIGRAVEYAYGIGATAFEYQMMAFARAVRDGAKDEDAQHFEDFAAVAALLEAAASDDAKRD
jgi:predicted dehydrogenase